jgi:hypothetical protein
MAGVCPPAQKKKHNPATIIPNNRLTFMTDSSVLYLLIAELKPESVCRFLQEGVEGKAGVGFPSYEGGVDARINKKMRSIHSARRRGGLV